MFSRILIPIDGSEQSDKAMLIAVDIALQNKSYLELVHITQISEERIRFDQNVKEEKAYPLTNLSMKDKIINEYYLHIIAQLKDLLKKKYEEAKKIAPGLEISTKLLEGNPGEAIVKRSQEGDFDLIVMGSSGIGLRKQILGSTSSRVVNDSNIPILIVK